MTITRRLLCVTVILAPLACSQQESKLIYQDLTRAIPERVHDLLGKMILDEKIMQLQSMWSIQIPGMKVPSFIQNGHLNEPLPYYVTVLEGIRKRVGSGTKVMYAEGCRISEPDKAPSLNTMAPYQSPQEQNNQKLLKEAFKVASSADVIILALGGNEVVSRESIGEVALGKPAYGDSDTLDLPGRQNQLVAEVSKLGKPVIAVLLNGRAYSVTELTTQVPAIVEGWYLGQETGNAFAGVLFGDVNPSGHLPVTIARHVGQLPVYYYKTPAARRGYVFSDNKPLFPFGFGLSYITSTFGNPTVKPEQIPVNGTAKISVAVTNSGSRAGDEVVQMYVHHEVSSVVQPVIARRGFKRVHLEPGKSEIVTFDVGADELSILDAHLRRVVEPGKVELRIGPNSAETSTVPLTVMIR